SCFFRQRCVTIEPLAARGTARDGATAIQEARTMTTATMDPAKAEAFGGQIIGALNNAFATLMISVGQRTGLFDAMADLPPSSSADIAKAAGLNERYVREWLGGMTVSGIVEHDAAKGTYYFPPEHAASLTHAAGPGNLATFAEFLSQMGN